MHCPDCGSSLVLIEIPGTIKSYRCMLCGGVMTYGKGKDGLPERSISQWTIVRADPAMSKFGSGKCPTDGEPLAPSDNKIVATLNVKQCQKCHGWWFPTESLFVYDPAGPKTAGWEVFFRATRTLVLASMLVVGLGVSIRMVQTRQQSQIQAAQEIRSWSATYLGEGIEQISFMSKEEYFTIPYREAGGEWKYAPTQKNGEKYIFTIKGLRDNLTYESRLGDKSYYFITK